MCQDDSFHSKRNLAPRRQCQQSAPYPFHSAKQTKTVPRVSKHTHEPTAGENVCLSLFCIQDPCPTPSVTAECQDLLPGVGWWLECAEAWALPPLNSPASLAIPLHFNVGKVLGTNQGLLSTPALTLTLLALCPSENPISQPTGTSFKGNRYLLCVRWWLFQMLYLYSSQAMKFQHTQCLWASLPVFITFLWLRYHCTMD